MGILNDGKRCCIKALLRDFEMGGWREKGQ